MTALRLQVSGMRSRRCVRAISALVSDVPGVRTVEVDLAAGTVRVTGTPEAAVVREVISQAGYRVAVDPAGAAAQEDVGGARTVPNDP